MFLRQDWDKWNLNPLISVFDQTICTSLWIAYSKSTTDFNNDKSNPRLRFSIILLNKIHTFGSIYQLIDKTLMEYNNIFIFMYSENLFKKSRGVFKSAIDVYIFNLILNR